MIEWFGLESGIMVSIIGMIVTYLFCAIIAIAIWAVDVIMSKTRWSGTKVEKPAKEG